MTSTHHTQPESQSPPQPGVILVDALIDALRPGSHILNSRATLALQRIGPKAVPLLLKAASDETVSPAHRRRIEHATAHMPRQHASAEEMEPAVVNALSAAIRTGDEQLTRLAARAASLNCPGILDQVLLEVAGDHHHPDRQVRILQAFAAADARLTVNSLWRLEILTTTTGSRAVRQAAAKLIRQVSWHAGADADFP